MKFIASWPNRTYQFYSPLKQILLRTFVLLSTKNVLYNVAHCVNLQKEKGMNLEMAELQPVLDIYPIYIYNPNGHSVGAVIHIARCARACDFSRDWSDDK